MQHAWDMERHAYESRRSPIIGPLPPTDMMSSLSARTRGALVFHGGITHDGLLASLTDDDLARIRNIGPGAIAEIRRICPAPAPPLPPAFPKSEFRDAFSRPLSDTNPYPERISPRAWDILVAHVNRGETMASIGQRYGITPVRVRQILDHTTKRFRRSLYRDLLDTYGGIVLRDIAKMALSRHDD